MVGEGAAVGVDGVVAVLGGQATMIAGMAPVTVVAAAVVEEARTTEHRARYTAMSRIRAADRRRGVAVVGHLEPCVVVQAAVA